MILYERSNLIFFFVIFLCLQTSSQQDKMNKTEIFHYNDGPEKKSDPEEKKKSDNTEEIKKKEKEISLIDENNKLKIKVEVYNIYLYFLIILNSLFFVGLLTFVIYKLLCNSKNNKIDENEQNDQLINNESEQIQEEENKEAIKDTYSINDDLLNNSGCEAPPVNGI